MIYLKNEEKKYKGGICKRRGEFYSPVTV